MVEPSQGCPRLPELLLGLSNYPVEPHAVRGLSLDSRAVKPGDWFLAMRGSRQDGRRYIADAVQAGAVGTLVDKLGDDEAWTGVQIPVVAVPNLARHVGLIAERFYRYPSQALETIGVTGTNGKTTVCHILAQALDRSELSRAGVIGTLGCGFPDALQPSLLTTPDPIRLHGELAALRDNGARCVVIEVSSHSLTQHRTDGVSFDTAVFTNLTRDHLDYHGTAEAYARAKLRLFAHTDIGIAVLNFDDPFALNIVESLGPEVRVFGFALSNKPLDVELAKYPSLSGRILGEDRAGLRLFVNTPFAAGEIHTRLLGRFNASNVLAALATLLALDVPYEQTVRSLAAAKPAIGRFEPFGGPEQPMVVVDYAHTPDGLEKALISLRSLCAGTLTCVFGCGGERDAGKRALMGQVAQQCADRVIVTNDNPRGEDPEVIIADILKGCKRPDAVTVCPDRAAAIGRAIDAAGPGDAILVAGKGHEEYQEIEGVRHRYSDRDVIRHFLGVSE